MFSEASIFSKLSMFNKASMFSQNQGLVRMSTPTDHKVAGITAAAMTFDLFSGEF